MTQPVSDNAIVASKQCASCPFRHNGLKMTVEKMVEIYCYLLRGENHFCHSDDSDRTICRGGRNYQLDMFARMGMIAEPTDEALRQAMRANGIEPKQFV